MKGQRRPRVYYAAGLFNEAERTFNLKVKALLDELGYETWFPQEDAGFLEDYMDEGMTLQEARHRIFTMNLEAVENADVLLFNLDGRVPDEGACVEAGIAFGRDVPCLGLQTDFRAVEPGGNNLMLDGILDYRIAGNLDELRTMLTETKTALDLSAEVIDLAALEAPYVAVSGPIGVGKTSLIEVMASRGDWTVLEEPIDENPYLSDVYTDMSNVGFRMQSYYLGQRARQHRRVKDLTGPILQERCLIEDAEVFFPAYHESGAYDENDLETLNGLYRVLDETVPKPDLIVYLWAPFDVTLARIRRRDREAEREIDVDFLRNVYEAYGRWVARHHDPQLLTIDTEVMDFVHDEGDAAEVIARIHTALNRPVVPA
jgi:deoxyadenosine/deoxycytidine kinase/nucleoside 2-deoxyribosyltransferase